MPDKLKWSDFSGGWQPSSDAIGGPKNALLQMDNLELDKNGALSLAGANSSIRTYSNPAHTLHSNLVGSTRHDYVADTGGAVYRDATSIMTGGDAANAAFAQAFDFTLIASGTQRKKDNGTTLVNLGIGTPVAAPTIAIGGSFGPYLVPRVNYTSAAVSVKLVQQIAAGGTIAFVDNAAITFELFGEGAIIVTLTPTSIPVDMTTLRNSSGGAPPTMYTDNDILYVPLFYAATNTVPLTNLTTITFQFWLDATADNPSNYFEWTWRNDGSMGTIPTPRRGDFARYGANSVGWESVQAYAFIMTSSAATAPFKFLTEPRFYGGQLGSLDGTYQWMQVNVSTNSGQFISKSGAGPFSSPVTVQMEPVGISADISTDPQVDQIWIYRRGGNLGQWYRTLVIPVPLFAGTDTLSDIDALTLGITYDPTLLPVDSTNLPSKIFDIVGPIEGRWFYFTSNFMYPTDINDPDLYAPNLGIRTTGSSSEIFLSARRVSDSSVIVLTSRDAYLLSGTFVTLPDGTVDIYYRSLGCKYPAISYDATFKEGIVFYIAADGWRSIDVNGTNNLLVSPITDRLYRGITAYGYSVNTKVAAGTVRFPVVLALNKLWCGIHGQARIEVLDDIRQYWRNFSFNLGDLTAICSTQDGQVLGFFASDNSLRKLDYQAGTTTQTINILSPVFDGDTPTQRHEFYTLKVRLATGNGENLTVKVILDDGTTYTVGTVTSNGVVTEQILDFSTQSGIPLGRFWQYLLTGSFTAFTLNDVEVAYDTRPFQLTHLHLLPDNYGTTGRKRIPTIPFVIDSLGNVVSYTPIVDGSTLTSKSVNTSRKQSVDYEFTGDEAGVDWEYIIDGNGALFEFFGNQEPQYIEKLPEPAQYHLIPTSNFGTPNKKRVRVWPFVIDTLGNAVVFHPTVDGATTATSTFTGGKQTFFHFYKTDVFGVDYGGFFTGGPFELYEVMPPDIVQVLPIARQFDQVGPEELFRYGRIKQMEFRFLCFGTQLPYNIYFNDNTVTNGIITVLNGQEASYFIPMPQGVGGSIVRIEIGPTSFNFHRFYLRLQVYKTGRDTDLEWVTIPDPQAGE